MSSPVGSDLTSEKIFEAVQRMQHEHPRNFLILCHAADLERIQNGVEQMRLVDTTVEVRAHSFAKAGHCILMRHPNDFEWRARFDLEPWGSVPGEGITTT